MSTIDQDAEILRKMKESVKSGSATSSSNRRMGGVSRFRSLDEVNKSIDDKPTGNVVAQTTSVVVTKSANTSQVVITKPVAVNEVSPAPATVTVKEEKIIATPVVEIKPQIVIESLPETSTSKKQVSNKDNIIVSPESLTGHISPADECPAPLVETAPLVSSKEENTGHKTSSKLGHIRPEVSPVTRHTETEESVSKIKVNKIFPDLTILESSTAESLFFSYSKNAKQLLEFIFKKCIEQGGNSSGTVTLKEMGVHLNTGRSSTRWVYDSLIKQGVIEEVGSCMGPKSEKVIKIHHKMFSFMMFRNQSSNKDYMSSDESSGLPSSIVSQILNSINYTQKQTEQLTKPSKFEFKDLDFSALKPMTWTNVNRNIRLEAQATFEKEEVQQFIDRFPMWLLTLKGVQSPAGLFCKELQNYMKDGDSVVNSFQSAKEKKAEMEFYAEAQKLKAQQDLTEKFNNEVLNSKIDEQFNVWLSGLTDDKKLLLVPLDKHGHMKLGDAAHTASLKNYFKECVFIS